MRERALTDAEREAMTKAFELREFLPEKVDAETLTALFEASFESEEFDTERFKGFYYRKAPYTQLASDLRS